MPGQRRSNTSRQAQGIGRDERLKRTRFNYEDAVKEIDKIDVPYNNDTRTIDDVHDNELSNAFMHNSIFERLCKYRDDELSLPLLADHLRVKRQTLWSWMHKEPHLRITKTKIDIIKKMAFDLNACVVFQKITAKKNERFYTTYVAIFQGYLYDEEQIQREFLYYYNPLLKNRKEYRGTNWDASLRNKDAIKAAFGYETVGANEITQSGAKYREYKYKLLKDLVNAPTEDYVQRIPGSVDQIGAYTSHKELKENVRNNNKLADNTDALNETQIELIKQSLHHETSLIRRLASKLVRKAPKGHHKVPIVRPDKIYDGEYDDITAAIKKSKLFMSYDRFRSGYVAMTVPTDKYEGHGITSRDLVVMDIDTRPGDEIRDGDKVCGLVKIGRTFTVVMGIYSESVKNPNKANIHRWFIDTQLQDVSVYLDEENKNYKWIWRLVDTVEVDSLWD